MRTRSLLASMVLGTLFAMVSAPAQATTPPTPQSPSSQPPSFIWDGVDKLHVACALTGASAAQQAQICQHLFSAAKINAPIKINAAVKDQAMQLPANEILLFLRGTVIGSDFSGTVGLTQPAQHIKGEQASWAVPVTIDLNEKGSRADRSIHAAMVRLLPWRQLKRATHSPPREY